MGPGARAGLPAAGAAISSGRHMLQVRIPVA